MARQVGGEASPKKNTSLNLVAGFYQYLRGKWGSLCARLCACVCPAETERDSKKKASAQNVYFCMCVGCVI